MPAVAPCQSSDFVKGVCHGSADPLSRSGGLVGVGESRGESKRLVRLVKEKRRNKHSKYKSRYINQNPVTKIGQEKGNRRNTTSVDSQDVLNMHCLSYARREQDTGLGFEKCCR